jgi:predicted transcriptional regulator of viral defense system
LRRGLYSLAAPYRSSPVHPFLVANALLPGSYVSLQSALAYYGLIPEYVVRTLSLTTLRPARWSNALGEFHFQHLAPHLYFGYAQTTALPGQEVFLASPEKALLDLVHLTPNGDDPAYLAGLRLQNLERLDLERLGALADRAGKPKWLRAVTHISNLLENERSSYPGTQGASQTLPDTPL